MANSSKPTLSKRNSRPTTNSYGWVWLLACVVTLGSVGYLLMVDGRREAPAVVRTPPPVVQDAGKAADADVRREAPQESTPAPAGQDTPAGAAVPAPAPKPSSLRVVKMSPTKVTFNYRDMPIEVEFSQPVNQDSVPAAFRVRPEMEGTFTWPAPNRFVFTPRTLWNHAATYEVTLEESITDANRLDHLERATWTFSTVGGYNYTRDILPLVSAHCASCHRSPGPAARVRLDTYADVMKFIQPGNAGNSRFVVALGDNNHAGKIDPKVEKRAYLLRDWIADYQAID